MRPEPPGFDIRCVAENGRSRVVVSGELDLATAERFESALRRHLASGPVLLDLRALSFMDSSGVRGLHAVMREAAGEGWTLAVTPRLQDNVRQVLAITGMLDALPFDDTASEQSA